MIINFPHDLLIHRHSWRSLKMSELSELYVSMLIKSLGLSLISVFIPIYLYQLGRSVADIALFYTLVFILRIFIDAMAAKVVGYFGPKHIMIVSQLVLVMSMLQLFTIEQIAWSMPFIAFTVALANGLYFVSYHIEFSKLQHSHRGGHELGRMYQIATIGSAFGPVIGGVIADRWGVSVSIGIAIVMVLASAIPLSLSPEPVRRHQKVTLRDFPFKKVRFDILSDVGLGFDQVVTMFLWPLYLSVFIFSEDIYGNVGLVTSIGLVTSFVIAKAYGNLIDHRKGRLLLRYGVAGQSLSHLLRVFITAPSAIFLFNSINEPMQVAVRMPYSKGMYGAASQYEGYRDAYIGVVLTASNIVRALAWGMIYLIASSGEVQLAFKAAFVMASLSVWIVLFERYKALN